MGLRLDSSGSKVFNVLSESAYIEREAYLRTAEDGDNGVIYVQNAPYTKEKVAASGTYEEEDVTGGKRYTFKQRGRTYISYGDHDVALSGNYRIKYTKSSSDGLKMSAGGAVYYNLSSTGGPNKHKITLSNGTIVYADRIEGPLYGDYKRSTIEVQKMVNGEWTSPSDLDPGTESVNFYFYIEKPTNVGHVRVISSIGPDLLGKVLVPAKLHKETTREIRYAPWRYIPSQKTQQKKTFLVQGASTAVQNFAFDGMEDID